MAKILVVEDDVQIAETIANILQLERYSVESISDGKEAAFRLSSYEYDLVILDWQLPDLTGYEVLSGYRGSGGKVPILMLTGRTSIDDKERGLDAGADDYLTKPFAPRELTARVRALLRRASGSADNVLRSGGIELDPSLYTVSRGGEPVDLQKLEFRLLEFFMRNPNRVFSQEAILDRGWQSDSDSSPEAVRSSVRRLRQRVDPQGELLQTVYGVGYVWRVK